MCVYVLWGVLVYTHFTGNKNGSKLYGSEQMRQNRRKCFGKLLIKRTYTNAW